MFGINSDTVTVQIYLIILNLVTHCILPITSLIFFNLAVYNKVSVILSSRVCKMFAIF